MEDGKELITCTNNIVDTQQILLITYVVGLLFLGGINAAFYNFENMGTVLTGVNRKFCVEKGHI